MGPVGAQVQPVPELLQEGGVLRGLGLEGRTLPQRGGERLVALVRVPRPEGRVRAGLLVLFARSGAAVRLGLRRSAQELATRGPEPLHKSRAALFDARHRRRPPFHQAPRPQAWVLTHDVFIPEPRPEGFELAHADASELLGLLRRPLLLGHRELAEGPVGWTACPVANDYDYAPQIPQPAVPCMAMDHPAPKNQTRPRQEEGRGWREGGGEHGQF